DIDMARAADLLGMERRQAEAIRDLPRGTFLALGPAVSRRPVSVRIGPVETSTRSGSPKLTPLPSAPAADLQQLVFAADAVDDAPQLPMAFEARPRRVPADELIADLSRPTPARTPEAERDPAEVAAILAQVMRAIVDDPESALRPASVLFQDFQVRCRMAGLARPPLDLSAFARRLAAARGGVFDLDGAEWADALALAASLPDDMLGAFLLIARAARTGEPAPSDTALAQTYGTSSLGRVRRLIANIESRDLIVCRTDLSGKRSITIPGLGWTTAAAEAA
ncbi:MAG TPA: ATP-binding protein, partial [Sphingomonas sp.]|nr:ATP-binding protein [Sphingomonas sp.]